MPGAQTAQGTRRTVHGQNMTKRILRDPPGLRSRPACLSSAAGRSYFGGVGWAVCLSAMYAAGRSERRQRRRWCLDGASGSSPRGRQRSQQPFL